MKALQTQQGEEAVGFVDFCDVANNAEIHLGVDTDGPLTSEEEGGSRCDRETS